MLMKLGISFNTIVAAILAVPIVKYMMSPVIPARESRVTIRGFLWGTWNNFPRVKLALPFTEIP